MRLRLFLQFSLCKGEASEQVHCCAGPSSLPFAILVPIIPCIVLKNRETVLTQIMLIGYMVMRLDDYCSAVLAFMAYFMYGSLCAVLSCK